MESASLLTQVDWQRALTDGQARAAELFSRPKTEQKRLGYFHTLKEICQQPWTWLRTCDRMIASRDSLTRMWQEFEVWYSPDPGVQSMRRMCTPPTSKRAGHMYGINKRRITANVWRKSFAPGKAGFACFFSAIRRKPRE